MAKAEYLPSERGYNARFVVTNLDEEDYTSHELYEDLHCVRGQMESRIKEQQLDLFADHTLTTKMVSCDCTIPSSPTN